MQKRIFETTRPARARFVPPSVPHEPWLIERLKDPREAAAYLEAAIEDGDQAVLMLALRHVAKAHGGVSEVARRSKLTREATYRMLPKAGNPELRSLTAILRAAGLRLSVTPRDPGRETNTAVSLQRAELVEERRRRRAAN